MPSADPRSRCLVPRRTARVWFWCPRIATPAATRRRPVIQKGSAGSHLIFPNGSRRIYLVNTLVGLPQRNRNQIVHPARGTLIVRDNQLKRPVFFESLAVTRIGHQHSTRVKFWIDLSQRKHDRIPVGTSSDDVARHRFSVKFLAERHIHLL